MCNPLIQILLKKVKSNKDNFCSDSINASLFVPSDSFTLVDVDQKDKLPSQNPLINSNNSQILENKNQHFKVFFYQQLKSRRCPNPLSKADHDHVRLFHLRITH